jgi:elongation factor Ts
MTSQPVTITAQQVKELREKTGAGFMDCRAALIEAGGDLERAAQLLRKRGQTVAQKKAGRQAAEGAIGSYVHTGGKLGVLVEVNCETDFVARTTEFQRLCHDLALHIAALSPRFLRREDVPAEVIEAERQALREQASEIGDPGEIERLLQGRLEKFFEENCLYEQRFIRDESLTIRDLVEQTTALLGEKISVRRFVVFKVGDPDTGMGIVAARQASGTSD